MWLIGLPSVRQVNEPFSLLLPVYAGDWAPHVAQAFRSTVTDQTRRPAEVVIVQDGRIAAPLASTLERLESTSPVPVSRLRLHHNVGLAQALQCGLSTCSHDIVARMDADDISLPHRFEVQLPVIEAGADLVGAGMVEVAEDGTDAGALRIHPTSASDIAAAARMRSPFNHPTVVYRRTAVLEAGGYRDLPLLEDYWLFTRMISAGSRMANVAEPLVLYRVDAGAYHRRGGVRLLRSEVRLQGHLRREGFTTRAEWLRNLTVRGGYRLVPVPIRRGLYRRAFTTSAAGVALAPTGSAQTPAATSQEECR